MHVVQDQFPTILYRHTRNTVAAVQVNDLHNAIFNGQAAAKRRSDVKTAGCQYTGNGLAVRLSKGIKEEWAVPVSSKYIVQITGSKALFNHSAFIDLIGAGGFFVHFL